MKRSHAEVMRLHFIRNNDAADECADLNRAMIEEGAKYIPALIEKAHEAQRASDIADARRLLAKHGLDGP